MLLLVSIRPDTAEQKGRERRYFSCVAVDKDRMIALIQNCFQSTGYCGIRNHDERFFISRNGELEELYSFTFQEGEVLRRIFLLYQCPITLVLLRRTNNLNVEGGGVGFMRRCGEHTIQISA